MYKKLLLCLLSLLLPLSFTCSVTAKPKTKKGKPHSHKKKTKKKENSSTISKASPLINQVFHTPEEKIKNLAQFNLTRQEISLVFYLASLSNRPLTKKEMVFITTNKGNWAKITWRFGLPSIIPEEGILIFRHPQQTNHFPPVGKKNYKYHHKGIKETLTIKGNKYEYKYDNKKLKIKKQIEITANKYEYKYKNQRRGIKEKLEVKYPSNKYEYHYHNRQTGAKIKQEGIGRRITPQIIYHRLKRKQQQTDNFHLSIKININF